MLCLLNCVTGTIQVMKGCKYFLQGSHFGQPWIKVSNSKSLPRNENPTQDNPDLEIKYLHTHAHTHTHARARAWRETRNGRMSGSITCHISADRNWWWRGCILHEELYSHFFNTFTTMGDIILISGTIMVDNGIFSDRIHYFPLYCHVHWQHPSGHARWVHSNICMLLVD
jgi:hypothetical protein